MTVQLSETEKQILDGSQGEAAQLAMQIIVRMAEIAGAPALIEISQAHIDACTMLTHSGLKFLELLVEKGGRVVVPTTTNPLPIDLENYPQQGLSDDYIAMALRSYRAYLNLGVNTTWTCAPYQEIDTPNLGEQVAWGESNAIAYVNSVLGARTERYPDYMDVCAALTGRVPASGLHLRENRRGQVLFSVEGIDDNTLQSDTFFVALGFLVGKLTLEKIPVITGVPAATLDQLKALGAAAASSGSVGLFHMVGITPEAKTQAEAFQGGQPEMEFMIFQKEIEEALQELNQTTDAAGKLDLVVFGCPHFSLREFGELNRILAELPAGEKFATRVIVEISPASYQQLKNENTLARFEQAGGEFLVGSCLFHTPILRETGLKVMTNSGKFAYYGPGELKAQVAFGSLEACLRSAMAGKVSL
ncbi:MAG TPA: aconitase X catalytic domain-containing protein [Anaerolineaceae bacterium]|nr:aconitase X catalytic domain-containing protein [Anaerolineaceae bacterium]